MALPRSSFFGSFAVKGRVGIKTPDLHVSKKSSSEFVVTCANNPEFVLVLNTATATADGQAIFVHHDAKHKSEETATACSFVVQRRGRGIWRIDDLTNPEFWIEIDDRGL